MAVTATVVYVDISRRKKRVGVRFVPSGNYVQVTGEALDLTKVSSAHVGGYVGGVPEAAKVVNSPVGYGSEVTLGAGLTNSKLNFYKAAGTELDAGAYPAALANDANGVLVEFVGPIGRM